MEDLLDLYTHKAIDTDFSVYRVINADVVMYRSGINASITAILERFNDLIDKSVDLQLFIKGNRLFFTFEKVKYWAIVSCWANEWQFIDQLINELSLIAEDVCYKEGELD